MSENSQRTERDLWQDYLFLTREMAKLLRHDDFPLFEELLLQRIKLQGMIEDCLNRGGQAGGFATEEDRHALLSLVRTANEMLDQEWRIYYNGRKNQSTAAMAYEGLDNPLVGWRMDKQR